MKSLKSGGAVLMLVGSLAGGLTAAACTKASAEQSADVKSAMEKLQFLVGRFALKPIKARASDTSAAGVTIENTFTPDGSSLRQVVHIGGADSGEKIWTYDPDKHQYHVKSAAEDQDAAPELTGQFEGDTLVLQQMYPAYGSTGLLPNVHDGVIEIARVFPGRAAAKAGLRAGDMITKIDGKSLAGLEYPNSLLIGPPDTDVVVTVRRKDSEHDYTLRRQSVVMTYRKTLRPRRGGGYRQITSRTDVQGVSASGSDAVPVSP